MPQISVAGAIVALVVLVGIRAASANRLIRKKFTFALLLCAGFLVLMLVDPALDPKSDLHAQVQSIARLMALLAAINVLVSLLINPLRVDRIPDQFPNIVQDTIIIGLFLVVGTAVAPEKWLALSAVGGFVIGFALQDTLGNMFAGLAIQVEKPFRTGQWISAGAHEGQVSEITWRATRLLTKAGNYVVVPNNILSKEAIVNFSQPTSLTRLIVTIGVSYDAAPNDVKTLLGQAVRGLDLVQKTPEPQVGIAEFASSAIVYFIKFWIANFADDDLARDQVRTAVYYALKRRGFDIPYPIQVQYAHEWPCVSEDERVGRLHAALQSVDVFTSLTEEDGAALMTSCAERLYGAGEAIVRQGEPGESMFVVCRGDVRVVLEPSGTEVARIGAGGYFGEMSLLTGEPRTATVSAVTDCVVVEITADSFRQLAQGRPHVVEQISLAVAARRAGLQRSRDAAAVVADEQEVRRGFLARVQSFLRIGSFS